MKILHITASMDPKLGGVCQALKTMVAGLNRNAGIENEIVSFDDPDASFIDLNLCKIYPLGAGNGPWFQNAAYIPWLLQNLVRFDVVILHGLWNYQGFGLNKALRKLKQKSANDAVFSTKIFVMPHGMLDPYFQKAEGRKLKAIRNWFYWKLIEQKVVNQADGLLFTCEAELQLAKETFSPYLPKNEFVVGLGVDEPPAFSAKIKDAFN
ncbi:MAG: glycosyl transferase family 1, partial [Sphingobacteriaceae bacterium]